MSDTNIVKTTFQNVIGLSAISQNIRRAFTNIRIEKRLKVGGIVPRRFRRGRNYRGKAFFPGHNSPRTTRQIRNATAVFRGMAGTTPELLERSRAINRAKQDRKKNWKDSRLQNPRAQALLLEAYNTVAADAA